MPHITVKLYTGRSAPVKAQLADALARALSEVLGADDASISVGIEDVAPQQWAAQVYEPEIRAKWATLYKKPGYTV